MISGGYTGKYLAVELDSGKISVFSLPEDVLRTWVGCAGLGLHLLAQEITPHLKSTDPRTPIFIMTGPLTGTAVPSSSQWSVVTLHSNPSLHSAPCIAHGHGYFGARLKHAGWDGIVIRGASASPVYLNIEDDRVELLNASHLWGVDTYETVRLVRREAETRGGDPKETSVACIGPAGEGQVVGASVRCDYGYSASSGSSGIVWGAKKLKAIAVRGTGSVPLANRSAFLSVCEDWTKTVRKWKYEQFDGFVPRSKEAVDAGAHCFQPVMVDEESEDMLRGMSPGKNWTDADFAHGAGMFRAPGQCPWTSRPVGSHNCEIECHAEVTVNSGPYEGLKWVTYGASMEVATVVGLSDPNDTIALAQYLDAQGICSSEFGAVVGLACEMFNKGLIDKQTTEGIDLSWGNFDAILQLLHQMIAGQGFGAKLARGAKYAAHELGAPDEMVVHIRGGAQRHDTKYMGLGWQFGLQMAGAGPVWQSWPENFKEPDWGYADMPSRYSAVGKGVQTARLQIKKQWIDCPGICLFVSLAMPGADRWHLPKALECAVGWEDFSFEDGALVGERVITLQRLINLHRGFDPQSDFDAGPRVMEAMKVGPGKGVGLGEHFADMRREYYAALDWDLVTGVPRPDALRRLGLESYTIGTQ